MGARFTSHAAGGQVLDVMRLPLTAFDEPLLREGFNIYLLMRQLADADASGGLEKEVAMEKFAEGAAGDRAAAMFFHSNTCRVEIVREESLERFYFPRPLLMNYLTKSTKELFVWGVDRTSPQTKIEGLMAASGGFIEEMQHQSHMMQNVLVSVASRQLERFKIISFLLAIAINLLTLLSYGVNTPTQQGASVTELQAAITIEGGGATLGYAGTATAITVLGLLQTITSTAIVVIFFLNFGPLIVRRRWAAHVEKMRLRRLSNLAAPAEKYTDSKGSDKKADKKPKTEMERWRLLWEYGPNDSRVRLNRGEPVWMYYHFKSMLYFLADGTVSYYMAYIAFTWLGNFVSNFFFAYHLLDVRQCRSSRASFCFGWASACLALLCPCRACVHCACFGGWVGCLSAHVPEMCR